MRPAEPHVAPSGVTAVPLPTPEITVSGWEPGGRPPRLGGRVGDPQRVEDQEEGVTSDPATSEPEDSVAEEPVAEVALSPEPVVETPIAEEPVAEKALAEEPVAEKALAEEPVA